MQPVTLAQSLNLAATLYTNPAIWQEERAQIFLRTWQFMGPANSVANEGQYLTLDIAGFGVLPFEAKTGSCAALRTSAATAARGF